MSLLRGIVMSIFYIKFYSFLFLLTFLPYNTKLWSSDSILEGALYEINSSQSFYLDGIRVDTLGKGPHSDKIKLDMLSRVPPTNSEGGEHKDGDDLRFVYISKETEEDIENQKILIAFINVFVPFKLLDEEIGKLSRSYINDLTIQAASTRWAKQNGWSPIYINFKRQFLEENVSYIRYGNGRREISLNSPILGRGFSSEDKRVMEVVPEVSRHQVAHAIFDSIRPDILERKTFYVGAIYEAVANWISISSAFNEKELCESFCGEINEGVIFPKIITRLADVHGPILGVKDLPKILHPNSRIEKIGEDDLYAASLLLTYSLCEVLMGAHRQLSDESNGINPTISSISLKRYRQNPEDILYDLNKYFRGALLEAIIRLDNNKVNFAELGRTLDMVFQHRPFSYDPVMTKIKWNAYLKSAFENHGIWYLNPQNEENMKRFEGKEFDESMVSDLKCHTLKENILSLKNEQSYDREIEALVQDRKLLKEQLLKEKLEEMGGEESPDENEFQHDLLIEEQGSSSGSSESSEEEFKLEIEEKKKEEIPFKINKPMEKQFSEKRKRSSWMSNHISFFDRFRRR